MIVATSRTVDPSHLFLFASTMYMSSGWLVLGDIVTGYGWIVIHLRGNRFRTYRSVLDTSVTKFQGAT